MFFLYEWWGGRSWRQEIRKITQQAEALDASTGKRLHFFQCFWSVQATSCINLNQWRFSSNAVSSLFVVTPCSVLNAIFFFIAIPRLQPLTFLGLWSLDVLSPISVFLRLLYLAFHLLSGSLWPWDRWLVQWRNPHDWKQHAWLGKKWRGKRPWRLLHYKMSFCCVFLSVGNYYLVVNVM